MLVFVVVKTCLYLLCLHHMNSFIEVRKGDDNGLIHYPCSMAGFQY